MITTCASSTGAYVFVVPLNRLPSSISISPTVKTARRLVFSELRSFDKHPPIKENDAARVSLAENWVLTRLKEALGMWYCVHISLFSLAYTFQVESRYISPHQVVQGTFRGSAWTFVLASSHDSLSEQFEGLSISQKSAVQSLWKVDWDTEIALLPQDTSQVCPTTPELSPAADGALAAYKGAQNRYCCAA